MDSQNCTIISGGWWMVSTHPSIISTVDIHSNWHPSSSATLTNFMLVLWYNNTDAVDENREIKLWSLFVGCKCDYEYVRGNNNRGCKK